MNLVVIDKNPLRRGGPPRPPAQDGRSMLFVNPRSTVNSMAITSSYPRADTAWQPAPTRNIRHLAPSLPGIGKTKPSFRRIALGKL